MLYSPRLGSLTVIVGDGVGLMDGGYPIELAASSVPDGLRMPNARFVILMERRTGRIVGIEANR